MTIFWMTCDTIIVKGVSRRIDQHFVLFRLLTTYSTFRFQFLVFIIIVLQQPAPALRGWSFLLPGRGVEEISKNSTYFSYPPKIPGKYFIPPQNFAEVFRTPPLPRPQSWNLKFEQNREMRYDTTNNFSLFHFFTFFFSSLSTYK